MKSVVLEWIVRNILEITNKTIFTCIELGVLLPSSPLRSLFRSQEQVKAEQPIIETRGGVKSGQKCLDSQKSTSSVGTSVVPELLEIHTLIKKIQLMLRHGCEVSREEETSSPCLRTASLEEDVGHRVNYYNPYWNTAISTVHRDTRLHNNTNKWQAASLAWTFYTVFHVFTLN